MKKMMLFVLLFALPAVAEVTCPVGGGSCPATPGDAIGAWCCGDMTCDVFRIDSSYLAGSCTPEPQLLCCAQGGPRLRSRESAETLTFQLLYANGRTFDGLRHGAVKLVLNGTVVDRGRFDGMVHLGAGSYYWFNGDLFLARED